MKRMLKRYMQPPVTIPRWLVYGFYLLFVIDGLVLSLARPNGNFEDDILYFGNTSASDNLLLYGTGMIVVSIICIFAMATKHSLLESLFSFLLFTLLTVLITATFIDWFDGLYDRGSLSIITTVAALVPLSRSVGLFYTFIRDRGSRERD